MIQQVPLVSALISLLVSTPAMAQLDLRPLPAEESFDQHRILIETFRFYDWEVTPPLRQKEGLRCHLSLEGVSRHHLRVSMRLSMLEPEAPSKREHISFQNSNNRHIGQNPSNTLTILKVSARQHNPAMPEQDRVLYIDSAWLETTNASTLGKIDKAKPKSAGFLGGRPGIGLFLSLLKGIKQDGLIIGIRSREHKRAKLFRAPAPNAEIFSQLRPCFEKKSRSKKSGTKRALPNF